MMSKTEILKLIEEKAKSYGAKKVMVFGSFIEKEDDFNDIDIACDIEGLKLLDFAGSLENDLKISIDVFPMDTDNPFIRSIQSRGKVLYG